jgi:hypothetical protein
MTILETYNRKQKLQVFFYITLHVQLTHYLLY